jgi:hypothetical protein
VKWSLVLLLAACKFEHSFTRDAGQPIDVIDAEIDAPPDAFDPKCFGKAPFTICLQALPTTSVSLPMAVNTGNSGSGNCTSIGGAVLMVSGVEACVIAGTDVNVTGTLVGVFGPRPLVLLATGTINVSASKFDITSRTADPTSDGPNANPPQCMPVVAQNGTGANGGAGGGAGGSFGGKGGDGGDGSGGSTAGGIAKQADTMFDVLRGGCRGGSGAAGQAGTASGGSGGGAVYLAAQTTITISGSINASGAGGFGADGPRGGGGGGGSGGMIVLYAPMLTIAPAARVFANGGGGGGGAGNGTTNGSDGTDPITAEAPAGGGLAGDIQGTPGGTGAFKATTAGSATTAAQGGGGGGGGVGVIRVLSGQSVAAINVSPSPI